MIVASPEALAEAGADPAAVDKLAAGGVVLPARGTTAPSATGPFVLDGADADLAPDDIVFDRGLRLPRGDFIALVSPATAERWQADVTEIGTRFVNPRPLDDDQIRRLQAHRRHGPGRLAPELPAHADGPGADLRRDDRHAAP